VRGHLSTRSQSQSPILAATPSFPLAPTGGEGRGEGASLHQDFKYLLHHRISQSQHIKIAKPKDSYSPFREIGRTLRVLQFTRLRHVLPPIQLNRQSTEGAIEIKYIGSHGILPSKLKSFEASVPQLRPDTLLGVCRIPAKRPCEMQIGTHFAPSP